MIEMENNTRVSSIEIYDMLGGLVSKTQHNTMQKLNMDMTSSPAGIYTLKVITDDGIVCVSKLSKK